MGIWHSSIRDAIVIRGGGVNQRQSVGALRASVFRVATRMLTDFAVTVLRWFDREDRSTAFLGAAMADIKLPQRFRDPSGSGKLVVVVEFFATADSSHGMDEYPATPVERFTIGVTGVIDIPGIVPADTAVNGGIIVDREEESMMTLHVIFVVTLRLKIRADPFADIFRDLLSLADGGQRERAAAMNARPTYLIESAVVLVVEVCQNLFPWYPAGMRLRLYASGLLLVVGGL